LIVEAAAEAVAGYAVGTTMFRRRHQQHGAIGWTAAAPSVPGMNMIDDEAALLADIRFALRGFGSWPTRRESKFCITFAALLMLFVSPPVAGIAETQDEYTAWMGTPGAYKLGYVSGLLDTFIHSMLSGDRIGTALGKAYQSCIAHRDIQPAALVEMIDLAYKGDSSRHRFPASIILMCELQKGCASEIAAELKSAGLGKPSLCPD
jgi:hypothetical protein